MPFAGVYLVADNGLRLAAQQCGETLLSPLSPAVQYEGTAVLWPKENAEPTRRWSQGGPTLDAVPGLVSPLLVGATDFPFQKHGPAGLIQDYSPRGVPVSGSPDLGYVLAVQSYATLAWS